MKLIVSEAAIADLARLRAFLADQNRAAADRAISALIRAAHSLEAMPERGRPTAVHNICELIAPFGQSFYVLRYAFHAEAEEVVVLRIWHGRELRE
jgi:plasmid stabilization system protein ParE